MEKEGMTYEKTGISYAAMDPFKLLAQEAARATAGSLARHGFSEVTESRGESAYLIETPGGYLSHVEEGLGTKNIVADEMYQLTGESRYYRAIAQDTVAMIVNDMITVGALPISIAMHCASGSSDWFQDEKRCSDLIEGWKEACMLSRCAWGGGESPTLKGVVEKERVVLSGSAIGFANHGKLIMGNIADGDQIIFLGSSGIHANGLTLARTIAKKLPKGYLTVLSDGRTYGETLLDPTHIYVGFISDCIAAGVNIHYAVNITGHGWRKLMRHPKDFKYVIDCRVRELPIFSFLQQHGPIQTREMYGTFNMGAGFAIYVPEEDVQNVFDVCVTNGHQKKFPVYRAGHIEASERKELIIKHKNLTYAGDELDIR